MNLMTGSDDECLALTAFSGTGQYEADDRRLEVMTVAAIGESGWLKMTRRRNDDAIAPVGFATKRFDAMQKNEWERKTHGLAHADGICKTPPPRSIVVLRTKVFREVAVILDEEASVQRAELMGVQGQCDGRRLWGRGGGVGEDMDSKGRHLQRRVYVVWG